LLAIEPLYLQTLSIGSVCRIFRFYHHRHRQLKFVGAEKFSLVSVCVCHAKSAQSEIQYAVLCNNFTLSPIILLTFTFISRYEYSL